MTTIHSFPTEQIRHILALAYPPGEKGSGRGLGLSALVHSSWHQPSVSVMTKQLAFSDQNETRLRNFMEHGPLGFECARLRFEGVDSDDICVVLGKARVGGIAALDVSQTMFPLSRKLFAYTGLKGVHSVRLVTHAYGFDFAWIEEEEDYYIEEDIPMPWPQNILFDPWPRRLRHLALDSNDLPLDLFRNSAERSPTSSSPSTSPNRLRFFLSCPSVD